MKRILPFFLLSVLLAAQLMGCSSAGQIDDLSHTAYVEIRAFSATDQSYTDYVISDYQVVNRLCATFNALTLEKVRITKPLAIGYTLLFYDHAHRPVDSVSIVFGNENYVDYQGQLYRVTSDLDPADYLADLLATQTPLETEEDT